MYLTVKPPCGDNSMEEICKVRKCGLPRLYHKRPLCLVHFREYYRRYRKTHKKKVREIARRSRVKRYREDWQTRLRDRSNRTLERAVKAGVIAKEDCERCGKRKTQAHHDSYLREDWLKVRWLCRLCHAAWHRENRPVFPPAPLI